MIASVDPESHDTMRPASRKARMAAIRAMQLSSGSTTQQRGKMRRLLEQLEVCSALDGSGTRIRQESLACRLGISDRTLRTWMTLAVAEGLLECIDSWTTRGRDRVILILWSRVIDGPPLKRQLFLEFGNGQAGENRRSHPEEPATCNKEEVDPRGLNPSSPKAPSEPAPASDEEPKGREVEWEEVRELLEARGMGAADAAIAACRRNRCEPWAAHAVVRFWDAHPGCWNVGALWHRLKSLRPGFVPEANWQRDPQAAARSWKPPMRPVRSSVASSSWSQPKQGEDYRAARAKAVAEHRAYQRELEANYGFWWDDMAPSERIAVAEHLGGKFLRDKLVHGRSDVRMDVFRLAVSKGIQPSQLAVEVS